MICNTLCGYPHIVKVNFVLRFRYPQRTLQMTLQHPSSGRRLWLLHTLASLLGASGGPGLARQASAQTGAAPTGPAPTGAAQARAAQTGQGMTRLPAPETWEPTLTMAARQGRPVVVLWGTAGCPWCDALRREVLIHLWRDAARRELEVFEFDLADRRASTGQPDISPAGLAERFRIRVSPTVSFHGPQGELATRLVGYTSRDFYPAYLEERIESAQKRLKNG